MKNNYKITNEQIDNYLKKFRHFSEKVLDVYDLPQLLDYFYRQKSHFATTQEIKKIWEKSLKDKNLSDINFYIHIPFCSQRCDYCHNPSNQLASRKNINFYLNNLIEEMIYFSPIFKNIKFSNLSIGGGTPNILNIQELEKLLQATFKYFKFSNSAIKEVEFNPLFTTLEQLSVFRKFGFDRVSFGVQSLARKALVAANRGYFKFNMIKKSIELSKKTGFKDISLDLILGFLEETYGEFEKNLVKLLKLDPFRIEIYVLKLPSLDYLNKHANGDKNIFYLHRQEMIKEFLKNIKKIAIKFNYILGDPWGENNQYYDDQTNLLASYFVLIKNDPEYYSKRYFECFGLFGFSNCFGLGEFSISGILEKYLIFQKKEFNPGDPIYKITETNHDHEMKKYILTTLSESGKIYLKKFNKKFNANFLKEFNLPIQILLRLKKIKIRNDKFIFLTKKKEEIFIYSMFFLLD
jgi:oxygen-independent coproporphyrinogen-3 oxidase